MIGIGERIRFVRGDESLPSFADKLGIHKNTLARYEKEESLPDAGVIVRICDIANDEDVTPGWLIEGEGHPPKPFYSEAHRELRERLNFINSEEAAHEFIEKAGLNLTPAQLLNYLDKKEMISDLDLIKTCRMVFYDSDLVTSKRIMKNLLEANFHVSEQEADTSGIVNLDRSLLEKAIEIVEDLIQKNGALLSSSKKADLITLVYEDMLHLSGKHNQDDFIDRAERMIKLSL